MAGAGFLDEVAIEQGQLSTEGRPRFGYWEVTGRLSSPPYDSGGPHIVVIECAKCLVQGYPPGFDFWFRTGTE